ncbi:MAG: phage/plasmid primase, P4 family [Oscillospiraceae bacterium]|nr:phage/plasmid primase, P4 family [Oscillospiraceae bacterium]
MTQAEQYEKLVEIDEEYKIEDVADKMNDILENATADSILEEIVFKSLYLLDGFEREKFKVKLLKKAADLRVKKLFEQLLQAYCKQEFSNETDPDWYEDGDIDEVAFCGAFAERHNIKCINNQFYDINGSITDGDIESKIYKDITPYVKQGVSRQVRALLFALKNATFAEQPRVREDEIYLENGILRTDGKFENDKEFCLNRLNVEYNPNVAEPEKWLKFLDDLLSADDILTLQEFFGYCLVPTTRAQKGLFLTGNGGEGKSVVGSVFKSIFGNAMISGSLQDLENNRFAMASLENKLLFVDDDLSVEALKDTRNIKKIVTAQTTQQIERKGVQQYDAMIYSRILCFGNGILRSLYDNSDGFFRRQIIIKVKDKPERVDNKSMVDELVAQKDGIFLWAFEGLQRLIDNKYEFTISEEAERNLKESREEAINIISFMDESGCVELDKESEISSKILCQLYREWCGDNEEIALKSKTVIGHLKNCEGKYNIEYSKNISGGVRGFKGIRQVKQVRDVFCSIG